MDNTTAQVAKQPASTRSLASGLAALRVFFGVIYLSNALAKLIGQSTFDWGFFSFNLINRGAARGLLGGAADRSFEPLRTIYQDLVLANWGFFQWFLTFTELAIAVSLLFGIACRLGAVVALLLIGPIWLTMWDAGLYLWLYPLDLVPLLILAIVPTGRSFGVDGKLAARVSSRWPF